MMKNFLFFPAIAALFLISCSDGYIFADNGPELELDIFYGLKYQNGLYIDAHAYISPIYDAEYYYYYWIIDGESFYNLDAQKKVSYGEHFLKFVLIDFFGDTLSKSGVVRVNEPLKITLLSPIEEYEAAKSDTVKFQYKISGIDIWEENPQVEIYISTDKEVWTQIDSLWMPPTEDTYYWGIKAFTEQETANSEIRSLCIKN